MMLTLEFDPDRGYGDHWLHGKEPEMAQYLELPVIQWCHEHIGPVSWPKAQDEAISGQGWMITTDWTEPSLAHQQFRVYVLVRDDIDPKLITEFWMRFGVHA